MALLATAIVAGLLFLRNSFCSHVCPIGHLLGLYSRLAPFGWSVGNRQLCMDCNDHSCTTESNAYFFQGRSCGVNLYPASIEDNTNCLLCGQCVKACDNNNPGTEGRPNPGWFARPWFHDILLLKPMTVAQASFCLIVSGFIIYEVFTEWMVTKELLLWTPRMISMWFKADDAWSQGVIKSLILFVILPMLFWILPYCLLRLHGENLTFRKFLCTIGTAFIPIMAAAHATKVLLKTTSRIPYWEHAFTDPVGVNTANNIL
ncbi:MAG: 4Fe-4S binding protein, partial [Gammaproteobacteria bacterium]|nr:4Fe-4S binding protein [Gammaproteobacteria bacterium]